MPRYRFDQNQVSLLEGFLAAKTDPDFLSKVQLQSAETLAPR